MALPKEYAERLKTLVEREAVTLPDLELEVTVRGLTGGEVERVRRHERADDLQVALSVEGPGGPGSPMWDANSRDDLDEIASLTMLDRAVILEAGNRLSGVGKLEAWAKSHLKKNGSSSSRSGSVARSGS
jgi:hypothetical protein